MKKVIAQLLLFITLFIVINNIFFHFIKVPYSWGSYYVNEKCLEENLNQYNTILLGASIAGRQVNPDLFDSITTNTHTLNMGMDAMTIPELYYQFNHIFDKKPSHLNYILIDLCDVDMLRYSNLHTTRKKYYYNFESYSNSVTTLWQSSYPVGEKLWAITLHTANFFECALKFNELDNMLRFKRQELKTECNCSNLYKPLVIKDNDTALIEFEGVKQRSSHAEFLKHVNLLEERKKETALLLSDTTGDAMVVNTAYLKLVDRMIEKGKNNSVQVIFILPPKLSKAQYKNVIPVYNLINPGNRISLANPATYPQFYELKYAYDLTHLDKEGSKIYTARLAEQFLKLRSNR